MKTNLVDMVKVTPISKGVEKHSFKPTQDVNSREPNSGNHQSTNTFNQALEQHEQTQKAEVIFKQKNFGKNSDVPTEEQPGQKAERKIEGETEAVDESVKVENAENTKEDKDVFTELPEEETVDLEGVSQTVVIQEIKPEQEKAQKELTGNRESETESKINTLLSLLSNKTNLKVPKLEQYVTTMRDAGKSVGEILNTLKAVLEEVAETKESKFDLKDFVLKIVPVEKVDKNSEKPQVDKTDDIPVKQEKKGFNKKNDAVPHLETKDKTVKEKTKTLPEAINGKTENQPKQVKFETVSSSTNGSKEVKSTKVTEQVSNKINTLEETKNDTVNNTVKTEVVNFAPGKNAVPDSESGIPLNKDSTVDSPKQKIKQPLLSEAIQNVVVKDTVKVQVEQDHPSVDDGEEINEQQLKKQLTNMQAKTPVKTTEIFTEEVKSQALVENPAERTADKPIEQLPKEANQTLIRLADLFRSFDKDTINEDLKSFAGQEEQSNIFQTVLNAKTHSGERLIDVIAKNLDVKPEIIEEFFNSKLYPDEKVESIIQTVEFERIESFLKDNPILISQMMDSQIKDITSLEPDSLKTTLQFKSVKVDTVVIKEFIQKGFEFKSFSKDFFSTGENILLKHKERVFTVEKMTVRFIKKETVTNNEKPERPMRDDSRNTLQKVTSNVKRFIQQSFKDGYESSNRRMMDLARFQTRTSQTVPDKEILQNNNTKSDKVFTEVISQEKKSETRLFSTSQTEDKDTKLTQKPQEAETTVHETKTKTFKGFSEPLVKGEQSLQARNIEQMYQKIKDMTQLMARQQTRTELATIKLNPPELGRVSLEIVKEGNKISIVMQVETKEAQEILNKNSSALAARLVNSGFELQKVTVQMEKYEEQGENAANQDGQNNSQQDQSEDQDGNNDNEYLYEEEYSFADLLKGGIEENAG